MIELRELQPYLDQEKLKPLLDIVSVLTEFEAVDRNNFQQVLTDQSHREILCAELVARLGFLTEFEQIEFNSFTADLEVRFRSERRLAGDKTTEGAVKAFVESSPEYKIKLLALKALSTFSTFVVSLKFTHIHRGEIAQRFVELERAHYSSDRRAT